MHSSALYKEYGAWIVGSRKEQNETNDFTDDFLIDFEITAQENAPTGAGRDGEPQGEPATKQISFRGSEVRLIEKYG
jgi:hypothetical protein